MEGLVGFELFHRGSSRQVSGQPALEVTFLSPGQCWCALGGPSAAPGAWRWLLDASRLGHSDFLLSGLCWEGPTSVCEGVRRTRGRQEGCRRVRVRWLTLLGLWPGRRGLPQPYQAAPAEVDVRELGPGAVRWGCRPAAPFMSRAPLLEEKINHCPLWGEEGAMNKVAVGWVWKLLPQAPSSLCGNQWAFNPRPVPWGNVGFSQQWPQPPAWGLDTAKSASGGRRWSWWAGSLAAGRVAAGGGPSVPSQWP